MLVRVLVQTSNNKIGKIGFSSSFSFYFSHHITTIEGGAVLTDDKLQYNLIKSLKSHGWSRGTFKIYIRNK